MSSPISSTLPVAGPSTPASPPPKNIAEAAKQFEALMIEQLLKTARGDEHGWMGTGEETGDATAGELAEQQFAQALAKSGGLGLGKQIAASLSASTHASPTPGVNKGPGLPALPSKPAQQ
jgi:Rod binding domain-containing protein